jgi:hypothetical protein
MISKFWKLGQKLKANKRILCTKDIIACEGIYDAQGKPIYGRISVEQGAIFEVKKEDPIHLSRVSKESDAGKVNLVIEMENHEDWEPV